MKILSHRGYWKNKQEKNSIAAFDRSFLNLYGLETDLRDVGGGGIVVSHDMASENCLKLEDFLSFIKSIIQIYL